MRPGPPRLHGTHEFGECCSAMAHGMLGLDTAEQLDEQASGRCEEGRPACFKVTGDWQTMYSCNCKQLMYKSPPPADHKRTTAQPLQHDDSSWAPPALAAAGCAGPGGGGSAAASSDGPSSPLPAAASGDGSRPSICSSSIC